MTDILVPPSGGRYVPPHMRNRSPRPLATDEPAPYPSASSSRHSQQSTQAGPSREQLYQPRRQYGDQYQGPQSNRSDPSAPWSRNTAYQAGPSRYTPVALNQEYREEDYAGPSSAPTHQGQGSNSAPPFLPRRGGIASPSLFVFGDSFVGPLKLLSEECVGIRTFKGASAKGLNNPNSLKQVSRDLLPAINDLLAPPPYKYVPSGGRWVMLVFGNVDLQINYLYQLQHKTISAVSFSDKEYEPITTRPSAETLLSDHEDSNVTEDDTPAESSNVLADATETSLQGPALGPDLFVQAVVKAYTTWLEREIVNGPIGQRIRSVAEQGNSSRTTNRRPPSKVLIAAALPPLVEDHVLNRIPEKYVERLEEEHEKTAKAMGRTPSDLGDHSRTPWTRSGAATPVEVGLSTLTVSDSLEPPSPKSSSSSRSDSSRVSSAFEAVQSSQSTITTASSIAESETTSAKPTSTTSKTSIDSLLTHRTPLCTLPTRVRMTDLFNKLVSEFCDTHSDVLAFIDISPQMRQSETYQSQHGEVDRATWACPVDPTNIHPVWEPTLPLWLEALKGAGVPTDGFELNEDAEETFKAYELDKRRRTEKRDHEWSEEAEATRLSKDRAGKLRDE